MNHQKALPAMPQIHTPVRMTASPMACDAEVVLGETTDGRDEKGWPILSTIMDTAGVVVTDICH
jgi:hypothetical protein